MENKILATIGTITKKEQLSPVHPDDCKAMVLETSKPFPGYHGKNLPENNIPESLFLINRSNYSDEKLIRAIQTIKKGEYPRFDATPCSFTFQNSDVEGIRFKYLRDKDVREVIRLFGEHGIFFKDKKQIAPYSSIIRIRKFFKMQEPEQGIYVDIVSENHFYFEIPALLPWDTFEKITLEIKYNTEDSNFDAAMVYVYTETGILDLVRIFSVERDIEKLKLLRQKYLDKLK
jgi:hypothetical protein